MKLVMNLLGYIGIIIYCLPLENISNTKGIKLINFHINLNVIMLIVYSGFNIFINFSVFSVLLDPFNEIPSLFNAFHLKYPTRGGIQHLLILTRKSGIKIYKYNFPRELMIRTFEH